VRATPEYAPAGVPSWLCRTLVGSGKYLLEPIRFSPERSERFSSWEDRLEEVELRPPQTIEAPPVILQRYQSDDLPVLIEAVTASLDHLKPWMPWASADPLEVGLADFVARAVEEFDHGEDFHYAVWNGSQTTLIGGTGLHTRLGPGRLEIGYWVRDGWL
jgi:hypothetical protein